MTGSRGPNTNPHAWMGLTKAASLLTTEEAMRNGNLCTVEDVKELVRQGRLRWRKSGSVYDDGTVCREDVLQLSHYGWAEKEKIEDTSHLDAPPNPWKPESAPAVIQVPYFKRVCNWLLAFPKPWS